MMLRFIHAADLHLDSPFQGLAHLPANIRRQVIQSTFQAFKRLVRFAIRQKVDFILLAGDVFDRQRSLRAQLALKKELEILAREQIAVYIVHGNHDPLQNHRYPVSWPDNVHVFGSEHVQRIPFYKQGQEVAAIYGISYPQARVTDNLAALFQRETDVFSIAMLHTNCGAVSAHENYAPCTKEDLLRSGFDYWALGHVHTRRVVHEHPPIVYPGNTQGRHIREQGERGFYLVEVSETGRIRLAFQPASEIVWLEKTVDFSAVQDFADVVSLFESLRCQLREKFMSRSVMLRCIGVGQTRLAAELSDPDVTAELIRDWHLEEEDRQPFVWLESFRFEGKPEYERESLKKSGGIYGHLLQTADRLMEDQALRAEVFRRELRPLLSHERARRFLASWPEDEQKEIIRRAEALLLGAWLGGDE